MELVSYFVWLVDLSPKAALKERRVNNVNLSTASSVTVQPSDAYE
jgi:hypothetical protein